MKNARAKTINLLLYEGSLKGVISIADSSWNSGELFSAPRESEYSGTRDTSVRAFGNQHSGK